MTQQKEKNPHAVALGRIGGQATTERKARAVRKNGRLGGRPRKTKGLDDGRTIRGPR